MRIILVMLMSACLFGLAGCGAKSDTQSGIYNFEAPGNLESKNDLGCISADQAKNKYTPTDLYRASSQCVTIGRYKDGVFLFMLAGTYGRFDILRVEDKTAHQAITVAIMETFWRLDQDKRAAFQESVKATFGHPENLAAMCREIVRIGPPDYYPRYMIQHGMRAFNGNTGNGLVKDFDAKAAWQQSLESYAHCPKI